MTALTLFYSYSHEDEALHDLLEKHLVQLQCQGLSPLGVITTGMTFQFM